MEKHHLKYWCKPTSLRGSLPTQTLSLLAGTWVSGISLCQARGQGGKPSSLVLSSETSKGYRCVGQEQGAPEPLSPV